MNHSPPRLILASQSPRRRELLAEAGYDFEVVRPDDSAETGRHDGEAADAMVVRLARQKAQDVARRTPVGIVIGCDTVAECDGVILGKPQDRRDAERMLRLLRGREHRVLSGICLWQRPDDVVQTAVDVTKLYMEAIDDQELTEYLDSTGWKGKAGGFGYQDRTGWLKIVAGSESNVVGLPMELLAQKLQALKV